MSFSGGASPLALEEGACLCPSQEEPSPSPPGTRGRSMPVSFSEGTYQEETRGRILVISIKYLYFVHKNTHISQTHYVSKIKHTFTCHNFIKYHSIPSLSRPNPPAPHKGAKWHHLNIHFLWWEVQAPQFSTTMVYDNL